MKGRDGNDGRSGAPPGLPRGGPPQDRPVSGTASGSERPSGGLAVPGQRWLDGATDPGRVGLRQALDEEALAAAFGRPIAARHRVWGGVQAPWERSGGRAWQVGRWLGGASLLAAGAAAILLATGSWVPSGQIFDWAEVEEVASAPPAQSLGASAPDQGVPRGDESLTTFAGQRMERKLARGVAVELWPDTRLRAGDGHRPPVLLSGRVRFQVPPQAPGAPYAVRVGEHEVVVLGTVFVVERSSAAGTLVSTVVLEEGVVEIRIAGGNTVGRLLPGQSWSSQSGMEPLRERAPRPSELAHRTGRLTKRAASSPSRRVPAGRSAEELLVEAQNARGAGQLERARVLYEKLAGGEGPLVDTALGELGRIYADLRMPAEALATYRLHRQRFPEGLTRAETDISIIDHLARAGDARQALGEARAFLLRYPNNERRAEVALIAGDLERDRGDCRAALTLYGEAVRGPLAAEAQDDVAFFQAQCLGRIDPARAPSALRGYLARFPGGRHAAEANRQLAGASP